MVEITAGAAAGGSGWSVDGRRDWDPMARQRAVMDFYKANGLSPLGGTGWALAGPIVSQLVLAIAIRNRRTVHDRVTGTVVVADR
jgi:hypothetical protein